MAENPNHVYHGLLTVLMRLVFILYAEDRNLLSADAVFVNFYSLTGLFDRLRQDAGRFHDTMDQRFGAWSQLLTLFRLIYDGGSHGALRIPPRHGYLFDPDRYKFLEGRGQGTENPKSDSSLPHVPDGVIYRVLNNLLMLEGERLSYRTLDVEQIGSVYEAIMGFSLEVAAGRSIAIKAKKSHGAPATINLEELLVVKAADRAKWLKEHTDQELTGKAIEELKTAKSVDDLLVALEKKVAREVTPNVVPLGAMILQPSDERRRSGSHYTPRSLTEPIVRKTLEPVLRGLANSKSSPSSTQPPVPSPQSLLSLKLCDPAMGSGAFLVEACRQLGDELVKAWHVHGEVPKLPPDEDEVLHARRLVAQRCLYGVDKNPMAVDLAKLSLWLATLAKDHPFTFLDHAFRCGDSLVGLTREQIAAFHWEPKKQRDIERTFIERQVKRATESRLAIMSAPDDAPHELQKAKLELAEDALDGVRLIGDLVISAFFSADKEKARNQRCDELSVSLTAWRESGKNELLHSLTTTARDLRTGPHPITPFHWEIEFPEVFCRENGGFDAIIGNPPFLGGMKISVAFGDSYIAWLLTIHSDSHGNGDLAAHFFRRVYCLLRSEGAFGLVATNSIAQGDTRRTGLRWICENGGSIFEARRRVFWPGQAAVVVSIVHVIRGHATANKRLDDHVVPQITAFLFTTGTNLDPTRLIANKGLARLGVKVLGVGFTFDDDIAEATSIAEMQSLLQRRPTLRECVLPYIGGEDLNGNPTPSSNRYIIDFGDLDHDEAGSRWPELMAIVEAKVKPQRKGQNNAGWAKNWWRFAGSTTEIQKFLSGKLRFIAVARVSRTAGFLFLSPNQVFSEKVVLFALDTHATFGVLQSRTHEYWMRLFSSTLKDDLNYTPSDCFETFPFPNDFETNPNLETVGKSYYEFRAALMVKNNEGLTKTYNRFHDPDERAPEILQLRQLHADMDHAVLAAYGWHDLAARATCEFLLDYEEEEDEESGDRGQESGKRKKKKPWRYRWPDEFRDEVLARLLALNQERAEQERLTGLAAAASAKSSNKPKAKRASKTRTKMDPNQKELL